MDLLTATARALDVIYRDHCEHPHEPGCRSFVGCARCGRCVYCDSTEDQHP